jgi:hypothetical protein
MENCLRNFSYGKKFKLLKKDSDPSFLAFRVLDLDTPNELQLQIEKKLFIPKKSHNKIKK